MTVSVKLDGKAVNKFTRVDGDPPGMKINASDTSQLKLEASMTTGGKEFPFPGDKLMTVFGHESTVLRYKCEGGKLSLKPEVAGTETAWQELTPVK
jgi:hypothetical protein